MNYSLSFFATKDYVTFWKTVDAETARVCADRAVSADCVPGNCLGLSEYVHGVPTRWKGPSVGEVLWRLKQRGEMNGFDEGSVGRGSQD